MKRKATVARGAVIERALVQQRCRRMVKAVKAAKIHTLHESGYVLALEELEDWLTAQPVRTTRKGGIGR
jgi:hypothetical protein